MITSLAVLAFIAATPDTATAVIVRAQPGDTVKLSGVIPAVVLIGRKGLVIDARGATIGQLTVRNSSNISIKGGTYRPTVWSGAIYVMGSSKISIEDISTSENGKWPGVTFRESTGVKLIGARIDQASVAVVVQKSTDVTIRNVAMLGSAVDGINIASSHDVIAEYNVCAGNILVDNRHPDCIQMWSVKGEPPTSNITIRYNMAYGATQGFNGFDHDMGGFDNIRIEDNVAIISYPQGVALNNARNSVVKNNTVRTLPGSRFPTTINAEGLSQCGNYVATYAAWRDRRDQACP